MTVAYKVGDANDPTAKDIARTVDEDDLLDGSSPDADALTTEGELSDLADFGGDTPGSLTFGAQTITINGVAATTITVQSALGELVIDGTGAWAYTLDTSTTTHGLTDVTGAGDQVSEVFNFIAKDSDGGTGVAGSLTININDDGP